MKFLNADDVRKALPMSDAVDAMKTTFIQLSASDAVVPVRTHIGTVDGSGDALFMPSYSAGEKKMAVKVVTLFPENHNRGMPFIQAVVLVFDATNGRTEAMLDGTILTALRTGAASGAATDVLALKDATVAGIFGAGVQARTQLEAVRAVRDIKEVRVHDIDEQCAKKFADEIVSGGGITARVCKTSAEVLDGAHVVCAATTSNNPIFSDGELSPGTHINAVGSYKPHVREVPGETVARAGVYVDQLEAAWEEAGDLIIPVNDGLIEKGHVRGEVGDLFTGKIAGRASDDEVTFFKSVGVALQDLMAASRALKNAERDELGTDLVM